MRGFFAKDFVKVVYELVYDSKGIVNGTLQTTDLLNRTGKPWEIMDRNYQKKTTDQSSHTWILTTNQLTNERTNGNDQSRIVHKYHHLTNTFTWLNLDKQR